jgi:uncharacterized protein (DUF433 family)
MQLTDPSTANKQGRYLPDDVVIEIHRRVSAGETHRKVADDFGVLRVSVTSIARGETYKRLNLPPTKSINFLAYKGASLEEKLHAGYEINHETGCWEWTRAKIRGGYGVIVWEKNKICTHRLSYELVNGPIPSGLHILHSCDNPKCCNPAHLRTGTVKENMQDMRDRMRGSIGEKSSTAKLKDGDVVNILKMIKSGVSLAQIARDYSMDSQAISQIKHGKSWRHIKRIE